MAEFTWLNKQAVRHASGYIVQCVDRFTCEYRDGTRKLTFAVEGSGDGLIAIDSSSIKTWDVPGEPLQSAERTEILARIKRALEFQGLYVHG